MYHVLARHPVSSHLCIALIPPCRNSQEQHSGNEDLLNRLGAAFLASAALRILGALSGFEALSMDLIGPPPHASSSRFWPFLRTLPYQGSIHVKQGLILQLQLSIRMCYLSYSGVGV